MTALTRRTFQRNGRIGLALFAAVPIIGVLLLSASLSLFMVVLLVLLLAGAFAAGFALLTRKLRSGNPSQTVLLRDKVR